MTQKTLEEHGFTPEECKKLQAIQTKQGMQAGTTGSFLTTLVAALSKVADNAPEIVKIIQVILAGVAAPA